jgi:hypothetical protein
VLKIGSPITADSSGVKHRKPLSGPVMRRP